MVMSKAGGEVVLKCLLGKEDDIDVDALPWGSDESTPAGVETVVEAETIRPAQGRIVEEVLIKREPDGAQRVILNQFGGGIGNGCREAIDIKEEIVQ